MAINRKYVTKKKFGGGNYTFRLWKEYAEGDALVGKFVGVHKCQYKKNNPIIEIKEAGFADGSGSSLVGKTLVLNSCGSVDKAFSEIPEGTLVMVEYNGTGELTKGPYAGKEAHSVSVSVVEEDFDAGDVDDTGL